MVDSSRFHIHHALSFAFARMFLSLTVVLILLQSNTWFNSTVIFVHAFSVRQNKPAWLYCHQHHPLVVTNKPHHASDTDMGSRLLSLHQIHRQQRPTRTTVVSYHPSKLYGCCTEASFQHHSHHHHDHGTRRSRQATMTTLSIIFWVLSMLSHGAPLLGRYPVGCRVVSKLRLAALPSVALALPTVMNKVRHAIMKRHKVDASCMMLAASLGALGLGEYTESAAVTSLFAVSEVLEERAANRSTSALSKVAQDLGPGKARLFVDASNQRLADKENTSHNNIMKQDQQEETSTSEETIYVAADQVPIGALVSVPVGDKIPCDGIIFSGNTFLDESSVTGESLPLRGSINKIVSAGIVNVGPERIVVRTTAMASESAVARLANLVKDSLSHKSPIEVMIDKFAGRYAPIVFSICICMGTLPWAFLGKETGLVWTRRSLVTMVAACPCPLVISTPVSYIAALAVMAKKGVIVKGGAVLEVSLRRYPAFCRRCLHTLNDCPRCFLSSVSWSCRQNCF